MTAAPGIRNMSAAPTGFGLAALDGLCIRDDFRQHATGWRGRGWCNGATAADQAIPGLRACHAVHAELFAALEVSYSRSRSSPKISIDGEVLTMCFELALQSRNGGTGATLFRRNDQGGPGLRAYNAVGSQFMRGLERLDGGGCL